MYENSCYLMNYTFTRVQGITLQSNKYQSVVVEFLNNNGFKLHSPTQVRIMSSQLCSTAISKIDFEILQLSI